MSAAPTTTSPQHLRVVIEFSSSDPNFAFLSNFYPVPIKDEDFPDDDIVYNSVEACFQAAKFAGRHTRGKLIKQLYFAGERVTPRQAKARGGGKARDLRLTDEELREWIGRPEEDPWSGRRVAVMRNALRQKFSHPHLRDKLLATGDSELVERLPRFNDAFWGVLKNGRGFNMLGKLLMQERMRARSEEASRQDVTAPTTATTTTIDGNRNNGEV